MSRVIFFTGGDRMRITSQIGDLPVYRCMREIYEQGGVIAGTSAGAAAMSSTMLINEHMERVAGTVENGDGSWPHPAPERGNRLALRGKGRTGRLVAAVAQNPKAPVSGGRLNAVRAGV